MCFRGIFGFQRFALFSYSPFFATNTHHQNLLYSVSVQSCQNISEMLEQSSTAEWPNIISFLRSQAVDVLHIRRFIYVAPKAQIQVNPGGVEEYLLEGPVDWACSRDFVVVKVQNSLDGLEKSFATQSMSELYTNMT